ncbi:putative tubulin polyglutamylase ttll2 [Geranomyces michiganensis]|nr:putative tubulin polyglutamylase ttll2 [Geranomyces michiganensis]
MATAAAFADADDVFPAKNDSRHHHHHSAASSTISTTPRLHRRYYVMAENGPQAVREVLEANGWLPYVEGESPYWNLWWKGSRYRKLDYESCTPWQRLNHFPKTSTLTRKDSLYRSLRTMRGIYGGGGGGVGGGASSGQGMYDFVPETFALPNDYVKFVNVYAGEEEEGRGGRGGGGLWICKPADASRGRGIFVFRNLGELMYDCSAVLQRYIANPLLISGYKFDMRCYVVVRSYNPLVIYLNTEGLARFATVPYTTTSTDVYAHLTNTSINKHSPWLEDEKDEIGAGCRWTFARLRLWFENMGMDYERVWRRIQGTIIATLLPIAAEVPAVPAGCFELYGFEVNFGPALSLGTAVDDEVKKPLIKDILDLVSVTDGELAMAEDWRARTAAAESKARCRSAPDKQRYPQPSRPPSSNNTTRGRKPPSMQQPPPPPCANVGRLTRIFPFDATTAQLSSGQVPLTVGKPALKKIMQQVKKTFAA